MKYVLIAMVLITACTMQQNQSPQEKAEKAVTDYLNNHLNDPHSYESVSFGKLDSIKVDTTEVNQLRVANRSLPADNLLKMKDESSYDTLANKVSDSVHRLGSWQILHSYRAKNALGALILSNGLFYLDSNLNVTHAVNQR